jgi:hypothetical protein
MALVFVFVSRCVGYIFRFFVNHSSLLFVVCKICLTFYENPCNAFCIYILLYNGKKKKKKQCELI